MCDGDVLLQDLIIKEVRTATQAAAVMAAAEAGTLPCLPALRAVEPRSPRHDGRQPLGSYGGKRQIKADPLVWKGGLAAWCLLAAGSAPPLETGFHCQRDGEWASRRPAWLPVHRQI